MDLEVEPQWHVLALESIDILLS